MPLKVKVCVCGLSNLLTKTNLAKKGWEGDLACAFCAEEESTCNLFLNCSVAAKIWPWLKEAGGIVGILLRCGIAL